jgi:hypothetical protein
VCSVSSVVTGCRTELAYFACSHFVSRPVSGMAVLPSSGIRETEAAPHPTRGTACKLDNRQSMERADCGVKRCTEWDWNWGL